MPFFQIQVSYHRKREKARGVGLEIVVKDSFGALDKRIELRLPQRGGGK